MNTAELETIGLCIALEAIDDIAIRALLEIFDIASCPGQAEVRYKTRVHQEMFLVRLLDFSKEATAKSVTGVSGSCLDVLQEACSTKSFDVGGSVGALSQPVRELRDWLDTTSSLKMWIPTLEVETGISLPRSQLVFILGNHVKHNLSRLTGVSRSVAETLTAHGYSVRAEQVTLALDDVRERLQENYFVYYGTWLAELINNVRWGIQDYLHPVFKKAYARVPGDDLRYEHRYPPEIIDDVARQWFWRLMNHVRSKPYIKRFAGADYMKKACSMEEVQTPRSTTQ